MNLLSGYSPSRSPCLWNPVGVRNFLPIPAQRALRDTGLWSSTPLALEFLSVLIRVIRGFSLPSLWWFISGTPH